MKRLDKKIIEFVDTGNYGRSPMAELIARDFLERENLIREYNTISSGVKVDDLNSGGTSTREMLRTVSLAKQREIYDSSSLKQLEEALKNEDVKTIEKFFLDAKQLFSIEEEQGREYMLNKLRIRKAIKEKSEQTIARPDNLAVFPLDRKSYNGVLNIYSKSDFNPLISIMSVLATGDLDSEIPNAFGRGLNAYERSIEQLAREVPEAIKKIIKKRR